MKLNNYIILLLLLLSTRAAAQIDTLDEVVVYSLKEGDKLERLPVTFSLLTSKRIERQQINGIRNLNSAAPGLFIPDYGSKYTSAIYIRGTGSRMGNSAVGMYVDNIPYLDKTSFDFDLFDIKRIEILRGPQGTLYGRNSMGGLVKIYTLSPWDFQGGKFKLSTGNYGRLEAQLTGYRKIGKKTAFSLGGSLRASGGHYSNQDPNGGVRGYKNFGRLIYPGSYDKNTVGANQTAALRGSFEWRPDDRLTLAYVGNYEYADQSGYAYGKYDSITGSVDAIAYGNPNYYRRNLLNNGIRIEYRGKGFVLSAITGHQYLRDSMLLDQDFTSAPIFMLEQTQELGSVNQEIVIRSTNDGKFAWLGGVSGFYQNLITTGDVTFLEDGVKMIQGFLVAAGMPIVIADNSIRMPGRYVTDNYGLAAFAQTSVRNLFAEGFSVSVGLRLDYEKARMDYLTRSEFAYEARMGQQSIRGEKSDTIGPGNESSDFTQLLPKLSLQYEKNGNSVYASVSKGYKAGGFNLQMFSDLMQIKMRQRPGTASDLNIKQATSFKPEFAVNYELGGRLSFSDKRLEVGAALFYTDIRDRQIAEFAPGGQGRMIKNAGESVSKGFESDISVRPFSGLTGRIAYGYARCVFTKHSEAVSDDETIDYSGKFVPFVPRNTLNVEADYTIPVGRLIDNITIGAQYAGAGKIYWNEANDAEQKYYSLLNGNVTFEKGNYSLSVWGRNITGTDYATFWFKTFGNAFGQRGKPALFGATLSIMLR